MLGSAKHEFADIHTFRAQHPAQLVHQDRKEFAADGFRHMPGEVEESSLLTAGRYRYLSRIWTHFTIAESSPLQRMQSTRPFAVSQNVRCNATLKDPKLLRAEGVNASFQPGTTPILPRISANSA